VKREICAGSPVLRRAVRQVGRLGYARTDTGRWGPDTETLIPERPRAKASCIAVPRGLLDDGDSPLEKICDDERGGGRKLTRTVAAAKKKKRDSPEEGSGILTQNSRRPTNFEPGKCKKIPTGGFIKNGPRWARDWRVPKKKKSVNRANWWKDERQGQSRRQRGLKRT